MGLEYRVGGTGYCTSARIDFMAAQLKKKHQLLVSGVNKAATVSVSV